jgi:hypothetical protein
MGIKIYYKKEGVFGFKCSFFKVLTAMLTSRVVLLVFNKDDSLCLFILVSDD